MPRVNDIALTCPNCALRFLSPAARIADVNGRRHTDFHLQVSGGAEPCGIHVCDRCGFAGREESYSDGSVSYTVRRHVWDELTPRLANGPLTASEKYEFAAKIAQWDGALDRDVAELWLRGAWSCVDEGDTEAERYFRIRAANAFEDCLTGFHDLEVPQRAALTYLVGELWRRIGDVGRAAYWYQRVSLEAADAPENRWLVRWARQQLENPREWFN